MALNLLDGNDKFKREDHVLLADLGITSCDEDGIVYSETPDWVPIGEDNDEITREMNDEVDAKANVLGKINIDHSKGPETTEIDPIAIRGNDKLSAILYYIWKYKLKGDKATLKFAEVTLADKQTSGDNTVYGAFTESAVVQLSSWGGDTSKLNAPVTLNWKGDRVHGTFSTKNKTFTPTVSA